MIRPGDRVGELELIAALGAGGQGEVFLARPWDAQGARRTATRLLLGAQLSCRRLTAGRAARWRLAAIKVARPGMADSLHDEHSHLAAPNVAHAHLSCVYGARFLGTAQPGLGLLRAGGAGPPRLYLTLAYEAGAPLSLLLARAGARRPDWRWSLAVAAQVAAALAHLHRRGVVHHDVRPANLIVRPGPHTVLIDLGAAETIGAPRRRAVYGAAGWLPPERLGARPGPATTMVDVYGVGALLRTLTSGAPIPSALARLIADALAPDPARRRAALPSMETLLGRLEELAHGAGGRALTQERAPCVWESI